MTRRYGRAPRGQRFVAAVPHGHHERRHDAFPALTLQTTAPMTDNALKQRAAMTTATRADVLPEVPVMGDFVPSYEASAWLGFGVPKHTLAEIIDMLNSEVNAGLADPMIKARFADLAPRCFQARRPSSANFSPTKPRSGARW